MIGPGPERWPLTGSTLASRAVSPLSSQHTLTCLASEDSNSLCSHCIFIWNILTFSTYRQHSSQWCSCPVDCFKLGHLICQNILGTDWVTGPKLKCWKSHVFMKTDDQRCYEVYDGCSYQTWLKLTQLQFNCYHDESTAHSDRSMSTFLHGFKIV